MRPEELWHVTRPGSTDTWQSSIGHRSIGANSIWIADLGYGGQVQVHNPETRSDAINRIDGMLNETKCEGHRFLCGFDFPFGLSEGTPGL